MTWARRSRAYERDAVAALNEVARWLLGDGDGASLKHSSGAPALSEGVGMADSLTEQERDLLRHALGLDRARVSYRNHYSVSPKAETYPLCVRLAAKGLFERSATYTATMIHFHVTDAGRVVATRL